MHLQEILIGEWTVSNVKLGIVWKSSAATCWTWQRNVAENPPGGFSQRHCRYRAGDGVRCGDGAFKKAAKKVLPNADIVLDRICVSQSLGDAVDAVRRQKARKLQREHDHRLAIRATRD